MFLRWLNLSSCRLAVGRPLRSGQCASGAAVSCGVKRTRIVKTVGVLALQGDFEAHRKALERAGARAVDVRTAEQLAGCDGLIIPGGESTSMLKLLDLE